MVRPARRHGFVLLVALAVIALTTALVLSTALRSMEDARSARRSTLRLLARDAAEQGVWEMLTSVDPRALRDGPIGAIVSISRPRSGGTTDTRLIRTDSTHVWIVATARCVRGDEMAADRAALSAALVDDAGTAELRPLQGPAWVPLY